MTTTAYADTLDIILPTPPTTLGPRVPADEVPAILTNADYSDDDWHLMHRQSQVDHSAYVGLHILRGFRQGYGGFLHYATDDDRRWLDESITILRGA